MERNWFEQRPLIALAVLIILVFWKLTLSSQFTFLESPDLAYQVLPWYQVQAEAWQQGVFPLWDPYQWTGQPLLGQMQPGAAFPLNWPLFLAPFADGPIDLRFVHWHFALVHVLAAFLLFALARELGRSRYAALLAGLAFAAGGYLGSTTWPQMVHGAIWIPLVFLLFHRAVRAERVVSAFGYAGLTGGVLGLAFLSGHHQTPFFTVLAFTGFFLYFLHRRRRNRKRAFQTAGLYAAAGAVAVLVAALQLLPAFEYGEAAYRWVDSPEPVTMDEPAPYHVHAEQRLYPVTLLGMLVPRARFQVNTFLGLVTLTLALFAAAVCWRERWVKVYSCLALGGLALAIGPYSLLHGWIYALVPFADKARSPAHAVFIFQMGVIVVASFGVDRLFSPVQDEASRRWMRYLLRGLVAFGLAVWAFELLLILNKSMEQNPGDQVVLVSIVAFLLAALLYGLQEGKLSARIVKRGLLLLMLFELAMTQWFDIIPRSDPKYAVHLSKLEEPREAMEFLKKQPGPFRFEFAAGDGKVNLGGWYGLEQVHGYLASVSRRLYDFFSADWQNRRLMMNTVYTVAKERTREPQEEVFRGESGWKVFRNPDAYPRAWITHSLDNIAAPPEDSAEPPPAEPCRVPEQVRFLRRTIHRTVAEAEMGCAGYTVFADPYFPGWEAEVDGRPATVFPAFDALRAVHLTAGRHRVEFVYRPSSVYWGAALSLLGALLVAACGVVVWRASSVASAPISRSESS